MFNRLSEERYDPYAQGYAPEAPFAPAEVVPSPSSVGPPLGPDGPPSSLVGPPSSPHILARYGRPFPDDHYVTPEIRAENAAKREARAGEFGDIRTPYMGDGMPAQPQPQPPIYKPPYLNWNDELVGSDGGAAVRNATPVPVPPLTGGPASGAAAPVGLASFGYPKAPTFVDPGGVPDTKPISGFDSLVKANTSAIAEARGEPYKKFADTLAKRTTDTDAAEASNKWMALAEAGFAMAGGTSQHAMENIGKGADVGFKSLKEGQKDIDARRDKTLSLDMQLTGMQESLKDRISQTAMAQAKGQISTEQANNSIAMDTAKLEEMRNQGINLQLSKAWEADFKTADARRRASHDTATLKAGERKANADRASREMIANKSPDLIRSYEYALNMKEGPGKTRLIGIIDGSLKLNASSRIKSRSNFRKIYEKFVQDNGAPNDEGWSEIKTTFAADPNADLFDLYALQARGGIGPVASKATAVFRPKIVNR